MKKQFPIGDLKLTDEQWCDRCFELCEITMILKKFSPRSVVVHNNPADYGITIDEAKDLRLSFLTKQLKKLNKKYDELSVDALMSVGESNEDAIRYMYFNMLLDQVVSEINSVKKNIMFLNNPINNSRLSFNISQLKQFPIDQVVQVDSRGKFKIRDEQTPSCYWYKYDNTWVDFGGDNKKHDVIDLVMIINHLDFIGACKYLSGQ